MTQETPVLDQNVTAPEAPTPPAAPTPVKKKKKRKKLIKNIILAVVILAVLAAIAWAVWYFVFREKPEEGLGEPIYDEAYIGEITTTVSGYGTANAKDSATITLSQSGTVEEVYVSQGQVVMEGDPLYVITSVAAQEALAAAQEAYQKQQESIAALQEEMAQLQKSRADLTIVTPHAGKLTNVEDIKVGDPLGTGSVIAQIVDDTKLKMSLYYSYAYENDIYVGQSAVISVPATMTTHNAKVEKINKVSRVTPEGGVTFEVVFVMDNPGTLTAEMAASAALYTSAGEMIYPYETGKLEYYQTTTVATKAAGPVEQVIDLLNYANVSAGQVLLIQGSSSVDELIRAKQEQITLAQASLEEAAKKVESEEKNLENFSAVAPISGTVVVLSPNMMPGMEVEAGLSAITIADNTVMTVNISVDDRSRQYIDVGMTLNLNDWYGNSYMGTVESLAVIGENQNGVTVYPGIVRVDNPTGSLMGGYGLDYSFAAAQSSGCLVIPSQDVRYYSPEGAEEPQAVVYVKTDEDREGAIPLEDLPKEMQEEVPKGCIVMPVEIGLADTYTVEIKSGLQEGDQVYNSTPKEDGDYYG